MRHTESGSGHGTFRRTQLHCLLRNPPKISRVFASRKFCETPSMELLKASKTLHFLSPFRGCYCILVLSFFLAAFGSQNFALDGPVHVTWSWCFGGGSCEGSQVVSSSFRARRHSPKQHNKAAATIQNTVAAYASRVQNPRGKLSDDLTDLTVPVAFDWVGASSSTASTCSVS